MLSEQLAQLLHLEEIIAAEKLALQQPDPEKLSAVTLQKNEALVAIEALDSKIGRCESFLKEKEQGFYQKELADIEDVLLRCKDKNMVNGQIIQKSPNFSLYHWFLWGRKLSEVAGANVEKSPNFFLNHWFLWDRKLSKVAGKIFKSRPIGLPNRGFGNPDCTTQRSSIIYSPIRLH